MNTTQVHWVPFEAQPDVAVFMIAMAAGYAWAIRRLGPKLVARRPLVTRRQVTLFSLGLVALTVAASWPLDTIGDGYLFSVHMVQYLVMTMVAAPLLLAGIPAWLLRALIQPVKGVVVFLARPLVALVLFNAVLVASHWPALVEIYVSNDAAHFAMHVLWTGTGLLFWLPILSPLPEIRRLSEPAQMGYLFLSSVIPTFPASFLTWAEGAYFDVYANAPRLWGIGAVEDVRLAGLVMKLGGGAILWTIIAVIFFRWAPGQVDEQRMATLIDEPDEPLPGASSKHGVDPGGVAAEQR